MSTSASFGYILNKRRVLAEVSSDGYPAGIGVDVIEALKRRDYEKLDLSKVEITGDPEDYIGGMESFEYDRIMGDSGIEHSNSYIINLDKKVLEFHGGGYGSGTLHRIKEYPFKEIFDRNTKDIVEEMENMEDEYYEKECK